MTLQELKVALDKIVADGKTEVVVKTNEIVYVEEGGIAELRPSYVEKIGSQIVIHSD